jgi:hypothetical protein
MAGSNVKAEGTLHAKGSVAIPLVAIPLYEGYEALPLSFCDGLHLNSDR